MEREDRGADRSGSRIVGGDMTELFWFAVGFTLGVVFTRGALKYLAYWEYKALESRFTDKLDKKG